MEADTRHLVMPFSSENSLYLLQEDPPVRLKAIKEHFLASRQGFNPFSDDWDQSLSP